MPTYIPASLYFSCSMTRLIDLQLQEVYTAKIMYCSAKLVSPFEREFCPHKISKNLLVEISYLWQRVFVMSESKTVRTKPRQGSSIRGKFCSLA